MPTKNEAFDDWSLELPAIDGDEDEDATVAELDDELSSFEDEGDPFDDAVAGDSLDGDDFDELDLEESIAASDDDEAEIEIGDVGIEDFTNEGSLLADAEEWEVDDDYSDLEEMSVGAPDDGGEEGLFDGSEEAIDEALPELDADDDGELGEGLLLEDASSAILADEPLPPWADVTWDKKPLALAFEERGELLSLATSDPLCAAVNLRGELLVSRDRGETFETVRAGASNDEPVQVALSKEGTLYLLTASGALLVERDGDFVTLARSNLLAMGLAGRSLAALSADPARGLELIESADAGGSWTARPLEGAAVVVAAAPNPVLATSGAAIGLGSEAGLVVSRNGRDFELVPGCAGTVALTFAGEGSEAPLYAAIYRETENRTYLVRVSAEGHAEVVADLGATDAVLDDEGEPLGRANAVAWDGARNVLWVAGAFGLVALAA